MRNLETSILAIDVRRSRFGYALFEGPNRLLDWGGGEVSPRVEGRAALGQARKRAKSILRIRHPAAIVLKRARRTKSGKSSMQGPVIKTILREATELRIPTYFVSRREIREAFRILGSETKDQIANTLVRIFPELAARLPPRRKAWQSEPRSMIIFDAVAAGIAHWQRNGTKFQIPG